MVHFAKVYFVGQIIMVWSLFGSRETLFEIHFIMVPDKSKIFAIIS